MNIKSILKYSTSVYFAKLCGLVAILLMSNRMSSENLSQYAMFVLIIEYSIYSILGVQYNLINSLSISEKSKNNFLIGDTFLIASFILLTVSIFFFVFNDSIFVIEKYDLSDYVFAIIFSAFIVNINILFVKIARIQKLIGLLIIEQVAYPVGLLLVVSFINDFSFEQFIFFYCLFKLIPLTFFSLKINFFKNIFFTGFINRAKKILIKSIKLLLYNASFAFIIVIAQSIISTKIESDMFGIFKIGFLIATIPNLIILGFESLLYPNIFKIINKNKIKFLNDFESIYYLFISILYSLMIIFIDVFSFIYKDLVIINSSVLILILIQFSISKFYLRKIFLVTKQKELTLFLFSLVPLLILYMISIMVEFDLYIFLLVLLFSFCIYDLLLLYKSNFANYKSTFMYILLIIMLALLNHFEIDNKLIGIIFILVVIIFNYNSHNKIKSLIENISF